MGRNRTIDDATVLDRAAGVFWRNGYAASSMRDLTRATGLGAAALYHRFDDKDRLFVGALRRYAEQGQRRRLARLATLRNPLRAIRRYFDELIDASVADSGRRGCLLVNTALDGAASTPGARKLVRQRLGEIEAFFDAQLERARARGLIAHGLRAPALVDSLFGTVLAIRVLARIDPDRRRLRRLAAHALQPLSGRRRRS